MHTAGHRLLLYFAIAIGVALATRSADAVGEADWVARSTNLAAQSGNATLLTVWDPASGLHLRFTDVSGQRSADLTLSGANCRLRLTPERAFPPAAVDGAQFNPEALPGKAVAMLPVIVKFRSEFWTVYALNRPVAVIPAPFHDIAALLQPKAEIPADTKQAEMGFQKVADFSFHDDFLVPEEDENKLAQWEACSGAWLLHTAASTAVAQAYIRADAGKALKPAFSPNFYSLKGTGTNAVILSGYDFYDSYTMEAAVQAHEGEMGIVFYAHDDGYHAFTIRRDAESDTAVFCLWRALSTNAASRRVLQSASTTLVRGQWVKLRVKTFLNRVQAYVDNQQIMDLSTELPAGGRFGLYAHSDAGIRFDDVSAESNHDPDFLGIGDMRRYLVAEHGSFFPRRRFLGLLDSREPGNALIPKTSSDPQWLVLGSVDHAGHVFSADFSPASRDNWTAGLLAGYRSESLPYFRFLCHRDGLQDIVTLESVSSNRTAILEHLRVPAPETARQPGHAVRLMCDGSQPNELRLYRDGVLVLIHYLKDPIRGASGLYVGPKTPVRISGIDYRFRRDDLFRNRFEKNANYVQDPFMRHWASPEGQWIEMPDKLVWHQGDFFGRFMIRLPFVTNTEVHLGVPEGATNGAWIVRTTANYLSLVPGSETLKAKPVASLSTNVAFAGISGATNTPAAVTNFYEIHVEGYWLALTSGGRLLFKHPMAAPLQGRRARVAGFTLDDLRESLVERHNVKDYLFTESLHEWILNGGRWEVVNRFQCDPRWSHMNGEATNGLAALWTKYEFKGDFCMEMFAGLRMGWYNRCGDLNLTILNTRTTPSEGYSLTCTGWDPDSSQLYTRLYRNGKVIAESDKYLVPRIRGGNKRLGYEPLVNAGRDVHGAWYYLKLRRTGTKLEFFFDNELVLMAEDSDPIPVGSAGIWTYLNSMMVARVKISAEEIRPRPVPFTSTLMAVPGLSPRAQPAVDPPPDLLVNGAPAEAMRPSRWDVDDDIGHPRILWQEAPGLGPYLVVENTLGGGPLFAAAQLPPVPCPDLAGWRFYIKQTPGARVNFHYAVGRRDAQGAFVASKRFFYRLSGPDFTDGPWKRSGQARVAPVSPATNPWHRAGSWSLVEVWLPTAALGPECMDSNLLVCVEGFGNPQPSYEAQGLTGNGPGDGYAVRDLAEVRFAPPQLALASNAAPVSARLLEFRTRAALADGSLQDLQAWIHRQTAPGLYRPTIRLERDGVVREHTLAWVQLPAEPALSCGWARKTPNTLSLQCASRFPDRRFLLASATAGGQPLELSETAFFERTAPLPRRFEFSAANTNAIEVHVTAAGSSTTFRVAWADHRLNEPPVLLKLEGPTPLAVNFEDRTPGASLSWDPARMRLVGRDPDQGTTLEVFNTQPNQRLRTAWSTPLSLARHPVLQFRYRGTPMAAVSLGLGDVYWARLTEEAPQARPVRDSRPFQLDGQWHTWLGMVSDAVAEQQFRAGLLDVAHLSIGSVHGVDQTGQYTRWQLDDLVAGPAVASGDPLAFTPTYFDFEGVHSVRYAVRAGREPYHDIPSNQLSGLTWIEIPNLARTVPDVASLADGFCHLFLKARDRQGLESKVTDLPFLLDRKPLTAAPAFEKSDDPVGNGTRLRLNVDNPGTGAPLDLTGMKVRWNDAVVAVPALGSSLTHSPEKETLVFNWPYVFRKELNQSHDGQEARIVIANIRDGAGNPCPDVTVPLKIDYKSDTNPPTLLPFSHPTNILICTTWEALSEKNLFFAPGDRNDTVTLTRTPHEAPYLRVASGTNYGTLAWNVEAKPWMADTNPYLAFRIRRPFMPSNDTVRIDLVLEYVQGGSNWVSLTHPAGGTNAMALPEPIAWQSNVWYSLTLDVGAMLRANRGADKAKELKIRTIRFNRALGVSSNTIDLQSFYVFHRGSPSNTVKLNTYDASGIQGIVWTAETAEKGMTLVPASLSVASPGTGWVSLRARDKAGNEAPPVWLPMFDPQAPTGVVPYTP